MAKNWNISEVPNLVTNIYARILEREWDPEGLIYWGSRLDRGEQSVRSIINAIALSKEHMDKFIRPNTVEEGVKVCYRHLLNREADSGGLTDWIKVFENEGVDDVINGIINSKEYTDKYGDDGV